MKRNIIQEKSFEFAKLIVITCKQNSKPYDPLFNQLIKSGTSIGANIEEAIGAQSKKDFISKFSIAYKEARETLYWLRLMNETQLLSPKITEPLISK